MILWQESESLFNDHELGAVRSDASLDIKGAHLYLVYAGKPILPSTPLFLFPVLSLPYALLQ